MSRLFNCGEGWHHLCGGSRIDPGDGTRVECACPCHGRVLDDEAEDRLLERECEALRAERRRAKEEGADPVPTEEE